MRSVTITLMMMALAVPAAAEPCGDITNEGCCVPGGLIKYCENGQLKIMDCNKNGPAHEKICGWDAEFHFYNCGYEGGDPSEDHPYLCPGETCKPKCDGKECGSDECGGTCGKCPAEKPCGPDFKCSQKPCGKVPFQGCCEGNTVVWCEHEFLHYSMCAEKPCGWKGTGKPGEGGYECGFKDEEASGQFPKNCSAYDYKAEGVASDAGTGDTATVTDNGGTPPDAPGQPETTSGDGSGKSGGGGGGGCLAGTAGGMGVLGLLMAMGMVVRRRG